MWLKRALVSLVALNALFVLYIVMQKSASNEDGVSKTFTQHGEALVLVADLSAIPVKKVIDACVSVGPLETLELAQQAYQRLAARNVKSEIVEKDTLISVDYWVIIPPRPSERQALRLLKQLQLADIDSYVVTQGDYANAISLGLFTVQSSAHRIKNKMVNAGFDAIIQEIPRRQIRYWLEAESKLDSFEAVFRDLNVKISEKSCKSR